MEPKTLLVPAAQVIAITGTGILSGLIAGMSFLAIPAFLHAPPEIMVQQWKALYIRGRAVAPPLALICSLCYGYLAYTNRHSSDVMRLYAVAAGMVPLIVPYTALHMEPLVNRPLMKLAATAETGKKGAEIGVSEAELGKIMRKWAGMSSIRALMVGASAVLGVAAMVASYRV